MKHPDYAPNGYTFKPMAERIICDGKSHWRDCLSILLNRQEALDLLAQLANGLKYPDQKEIHLSWCGWLEQDEKGAWPFGDAANKKLQGTANQADGG